MPKKNIDSMEVSDLKRKIMEKLEKGKSGAARKKKSLSLAALSAKMGRTEDEVKRLFEPVEDTAVEETPAAEKITEAIESYEEIAIPETPVREYRTKLNTLEEENERLKRIQEEARSKSGNLLKEIEEKDRAIAELQKKLEHESFSLIKEDEQKSLINTAIEKSIAEYRAKLAKLEEENIDLKKAHSEELKQNEGIFLQIAEKDKEIDELKKSFQDEIDKLERKRGEDHEKSAEEHKSKYAALESETKKLKRLHEDSLKQNDALLVRVEEKDAKIAGLEKQIDALESDLKKHQEGLKEIGAAKAEKEKAVSNMEALRCKLYAASKNEKELTGRVAQLEEMVKHREKRVTDGEKVLKRLESEKIELVAKIHSLEDTVDALEKKAKKAVDEAEAHEKRVTEAEKSFAKNLETARKELELQSQAIERNKKALESKIGQLNLELEAKIKRIEETERSNAELDNLVKESALKLQRAESVKADIEEKMRSLEIEMSEAANKKGEELKAAEATVSRIRSEIENLRASLKDKEKAEADLTENIIRLESEIEARDKKIQSDIKYCEDVVREVNDLRQKIKTYRLKAR